MKQLFRCSKMQRISLRVENNCLSAHSGLSGDRPGNVGGSGRLRQWGEAKIAAISP